MFDISHLPELTDKYFKSLFFTLSIVLAFFSADSWLLVKNPGTYRENIKLIDFLISRLRIMVPVFFSMFLLLLSIVGTFLGGFFYAATLTTFSFYLSIGFFKFNPKKHSLLFWLFICLGIAITGTIREEYSILIGIIAFSCLIPYYFILVFLFKRFEKTNS